MQGLAGDVSRTRATEVFYRLIPVYRAYNNGAAKGIDSNHRITSNKASYDAQIAKGWAGEGVVMCAPAS